VAVWHFFFYPYHNQKHLRFCILFQIFLSNLVNKANLTVFLSTFISFMFRATMCPSSQETTVFTWHMVLIFKQVGSLKLQGHMFQNNRYQVSHKYSCFSWWWAHSHLKYVEKRNKHTKKNCAPSWLCLQDYTGMHGQQNIKFLSNIYFNIWFRLYQV